MIHTARVLLGLAVIIGLSLAARAAPPERIVIAGSALVEIGFLLGAGDRIVAVDKHSTYPPEVSTKASIGYFRSLAAEPILSLAPDSIVFAPEAGPDVVVKQLKATGIPVHVSPHVTGPDGVPEKISFMGKVLGLETEARKLSADYVARLDAVKARLSGATEKPKVLFIIGIRAAPVVAGSKTVADTMIALAGARNAAEAFESYKPMSDEAIVGAAPDIVLIMPDRLEAAGGTEALLSKFGLSLTPAASTNHVVTMEGALLLRPGPRSVEAIEQLAKAFRTAPAAGQ